MVPTPIIDNSNLNNGYFSGNKIDNNFEHDNDITLNNKNDSVNNSDHVMHKISMINNDVFVGNEARHYKKTDF